MSIIPLFLHIAHVIHSLIPLVFQAYLAQVNVFCSQLRAVPATAATAVNTIRLTTMQESRPTTWAPAPSRGPAVYFEAQVQLSHPTVDLPARALAINGGQGFLDTITPTGMRV